MPKLSDDVKQLLAGPQPKAPEHKYKSFEETFPKDGGLPEPIPYTGAAIFEAEHPSFTVVLDMGAFRVMCEELHADVKSHWGNSLPSFKAKIRALRSFRDAAAAAQYTYGVIPGRVGPLLEVQARSTPPTENGTLAPRPKRPQGSPPKGPAKRLPAPSAKATKLPRPSSHKTGSSAGAGARS